MKYHLKYTTRFKKDYKQAKKRGLDMEQLNRVIAKLADGEELEPKFRDHALVGDYEGFRECHILSDWLLVYSKEEDVLILTCSRTGSHSDLF